MIPARLDSICQSSRYQETALSNFSHRRTRPDDTLFQSDTVYPHSTRGKANSYSRAGQSDTSRMITFVRCVPSSCRILPPRPVTGSATDSITKICVRTTASDGTPTPLVQPETAHLLESAPRPTPRPALGVTGVPFP
ncbi:hypothetical protein LZ30DRAFT_751025 [Colletotrichum cereale]|nr:hypothetical protein LZ30DRAFT_751025 [Colletotrichum cereale]